MRTAERNEKILIDVLNGRTLPSCAKEHGVTTERIRQIVYKGVLKKDAELYNHAMNFSGRCLEIFRENKQRLICEA